MPAFGKRTPLTREHFADFQTCYGTKSDGSSQRKDHGEEARFRVFTREQISTRGDNLDISWLKDENATAASDLLPPEEIAAMIRERLSTAMEEMDLLTELLES